MVQVTGTLSDFGLEALAPFFPVIEFVPSGPGITAQRLLSGKPVRVTPFASGSFTVDLYPNDWVRNDSWYTIRIVQLGEYGTELDALPWKLRVPPTGGWVGDLLDAPSNAGWVWVGPKPPEDTVNWLWWINTSVQPPMLYEWSAT